MVKQREAGIAKDRLGRQAGKRVETWNILRPLSTSKQRVPGRSRRIWAKSLAPDLLEPDSIIEARVALDGPGACTQPTCH